MSNSIVYLSGFVPGLAEGELQVRLLENCHVVAEVEIKTSFRTALSYALLKVQEDQVGQIIKTLNYCKIPGTTTEEGFRARRYERNPPSDKNFFVRLPVSDITEKKLDEFFSQFGEVHSVHLRRSKEAKQLQAYIQFISMSDEAKNAFTQRDTALLMSKVKKEDAALFDGISIALFCSRRVRSDNWRDVFIGNIPQDWTLDQVLDITGRDGVHIKPDGTPCGFLSSPHEIQIKSGVYQVRKAVILFDTHEKAVEAVTKCTGYKVNVSENETVDLRASPYKNREALTREKLLRQQERAESFRNMYPDCNIMIHNLPENLTQQQLMILTGEGSPESVVRCKLVPSHGNGSGTQRAYCLYSSRELAERKCEEFQSMLVTDICTRFNIPHPESLPHGPDTRLRAFIVQSQTDRRQGPSIAPTDKSPSQEKPFDKLAYQSANEDARRTMRGNYAYEYVQRVLSEEHMVPPEILPDRTSQLTGMLIDIDWDSIEEFLNLFEKDNRNELISSLHSGISAIIQEENNSGRALSQI